MSNESSIYLPEYSVDRDYSRPVQWTADGSNWIEYDLTEQKTVSGVFFGNHNLPQSGFSMTVKVGNSSPASTSVGTPAWTRKGVMVPFTSGSYRYVRIEFASTQPDDYPNPQAGEIVIGERVVLPRGVRFGEKRHIVQEGINNRTNRGRRYGLELYRLERIEVTFRYPETEKSSFLTWWEAMEGMLDPFVWCPVDGGTEGIYVAIEDEGFLPNELPEQALDPVNEHSLVLMEEGLGGEILQ
jgi:hypothetical protein